MEKIDKIDRTKMELNNTLAAHGLEELPPPVFDRY
jgi:hypothetical protein